MATGFLHGIEVVEVDDGTRPLRTVQSGVIGIIGTAPDADEQAFPLNTPVLVAGSLSQAAKLDTTGKRRGTLPNALDLIFKQVGAIVVVIRVKEGDNEEATLTNILGGVNEHGAYEGVHAFIGAQSVVGQTPRILIAPGFTHQRPSSVTTDGTSDSAKTEISTTSNPVAAELIGIAERLRAIVVIDAPNTTDEAALSAAKILIQNAPFSLIHLSKLKLIAMARS